MPMSIKLQMSMMLSFKFEIFNEISSPIIAFITKRFNNKLFIKQTLYFTHSLN
jgi:hypothetical protein